MKKLATKPYIVWVTTRDPDIGEACTPYKLAMPEQCVNSDDDVLALANMFARGLHGKVAAYEPIELIEEF